MIDLMFPEQYVDILPEVRAFLAEEQQLYIGGRWVAALNGAIFETVDPSSGRLLARVSSAQAEDVDAAVQAARQTFDSGAWHLKLTPSERGRLIWKLADLIESRASILAQLDALDNGKPLNKALKVDVPLSAEHFRYYAGWANKIEGATIPVNARHVELHRARTGGRVRIDRPVELSAADGGVEDRACAGRRELHHSEACRANPSQCALSGAIVRGSRIPSRRV